MKYYHLTPPPGVNKLFIRVRCSRYTLAQRTNASAIATYHGCCNSKAMDMLLRQQEKVRRVVVNTATKHNFTNRLMCNDLV